MRNKRRRLNSLHSHINQQQPWVNSLKRSHTHIHAHAIVYFRSWISSHHRGTPVCSRFIYIGGALNCWMRMCERPLSLLATRFNGGRDTARVSDFNFNFRDFIVHCGFRMRACMRVSVLLSTCCIEFMWLTSGKRVHWCRSIARLYVEHTIRCKDPYQPLVLWNYKPKSLQSLSQHMHR